MRAAERLFGVDSTDHDAACLYLYGRALELLERLRPSPLMATERYAVVESNLEHPIADDRVCTFADVIIRYRTEWEHDPTTEAWLARSASNLLGMLTPDERANLARQRRSTPPPDPEIFDSVLIEVKTHREPLGAVLRQIYLMRRMSRSRIVRSLVADDAEERPVQLYSPRRTYVLAHAYKLTDAERAILRHHRIVQLRLPSAEEMRKRRITA